MYLLTERPRSFLVVKHDDSTGTSGNGQQAPQKLVNNYNKDINSRKATITINGDRDKHNTYEIFQIKAGFINETEQKWRSVRETNSHDDSECYLSQKQGHSHRLCCSARDHLVLTTTRKRLIEARDLRLRDKWQATTEEAITLT